MPWKLVYSKDAKNDSKLPGQLARKIEELLRKISEDPFSLPFEKLKGCEGVYSRRINAKHRLVYQVLKNEQTIFFLFHFLLR
jgi:Txe/YoeB family toxin of toxin-antitoxin system